MRDNFSWKLFFLSFKWLHSIRCLLSTFAKKAERRARDKLRQPSTRKWPTENSHAIENWGEEEKNLTEEVNAKKMKFMEQSMTKRGRKKRKWKSVKWNYRTYLILRTFSFILIRLFTPSEKTNSIFNWTLIKEIVNFQIETINQIRFSFSSRCPSSHLCVFHFMFFLLSFSHTQSFLFLFSVQMKINLNHKWANGIAISSRTIKSQIVDDGKLFDHCAQMKWARL